MKNQITKLNNQSYIKSRNILRSLGINIAHKGSIFLICAIQIVVTNNYDYIVLEDIYSLIAKKYKNTNIYQIKNTIKYAIDHRIEEKAINNFEKIFGFEYDEYFFTNKNIIEEISNIIQLESI